MDACGERGRCEVNKLLPMALVFALVGCLDRPTDAQQSAAESGDDTVDIGPGSMESAKAPVILTPITPVPSTAAVDLNNNVGVHFYDRLVSTATYPDGETRQKDQIR